MQNPINVGGLEQQHKDGLVQIFFFFFFSLSLHFSPQFREKPFWWLKKKTPEPYQFSFLKSLLPNTPKNSLTYKNLSSKKKTLLLRTKFSLSLCE